MPRDLVVGATGLLGWNLTCELLARGRTVRVLARFPELARGILPKSVELVRGDLIEPDSLRGVAEGCEVVYHVAGLPEQWLADPERFQRVNTQGTANLIAAVRGAGIRRFIHTSAMVVFAARTGETFDESVLATGPGGTRYERSKREAMQHLVGAIAEGLPAVSLHPAALYGPGPNTSPGLNRSLRRLAMGRLPFLPPGGLAVVLASDAARGHILAAERAPVGARYLLSECYVTFKELAGLVVAAVGGHLVPPTLPRMLAQRIAPLTERLAHLTGEAPLLPTGQFRLLQWGARPDAARARQELGWTSVPLEEGVRLTLYGLGLLPEKRR
jgi:dihydroflavonol-4-reductase